MLKKIKDDFRHVDGLRVMPFNPDYTGKDIEFEYEGTLTLLRTRA
jgi:hypothetical protein